MVGGYRVITLCGSTRFRNEFYEVQKKLTLEGNIVISVGLFGHAGDEEVWEGMDEGTLTWTKEMLGDMHKRKIDMADGIYVINPNGYIGDSTRSEIEYAKKTGKEIQYLEPPADALSPNTQKKIREAVGKAITAARATGKSESEYAEGKTPEPETQNVFAERLRTLAREYHRITLDTPPMPLSMERMNALRDGSRAPTKRDLNAIAKEYHTTVEYLLGQDEDPPEWFFEEDLYW